MKKEAEIKIIFDKARVKWLCYKGEDGKYLHRYACADCEQLLNDIMLLAKGHSPIKDEWDGNMYEYYSPVFDDEITHDGDFALFPGVQENIGWWEV